MWACMCMWICGHVHFSCLFVLTQGFSRYPWPRLTLNSEIHSQVLGLEVCTTTHGMGNSQVDILYLFSITSIPFETGSFTELRAHCCGYTGCPGSLSNPPDCLPPQASSGVIYIYTLPHLTHILVLRILLVLVL